MNTTSKTQTTAHHDLGVLGLHDTLTCDCGLTLENLEAWHAHTVRTYNNPDERAISCRGSRVHSILTIDADAYATISPCAKVACCNHRNGQECWRIDTGGFKLYGFPNVDAARHLTSRGGIVSETYLYSTC